VASSHFFRILGDLSSLDGGAEQHPIAIQPLGFAYPAQARRPRRLSSTLQRCFGRAAGSAFVQADRRIDVMCHQRATPDDDAWNFWHHLCTAPLIPAAAPSPGVRGP
jgi:hypothetical protein